jgi:hypothetical protein
VASVGVYARGKFCGNLKVLRPSELLRSPARQAADHYTSFGEHQSTGRKMIEEAKIIDQPYSGEFEERIYDNESVWNSSNWSWIKFVNDDYTEWCGQFRGSPRQVALSKKYNTVLVLTSDYMFQLDRLSGNIMEIEGTPQYHNLTVSPNGEYLIADYYRIEKISKNICLKVEIKSPVQMDNIKFGSWSEDILEITCDEFMNWDRHLIMEYNCNTNKIEMK